MDDTSDADEKRTSDGPPRASRRTARAGRAKRKAAPKAQTGRAAVANTFAPRPFPKDPIERAMKVAVAIRDHNGGHPWPPADVAGAMGLSVSGTAFFYAAAAAREYGLTDGGRDVKKIGLTGLGRTAVYPASQKEAQDALWTAFRRVDLFAGVLLHYGGNRLPELQYVKNTLKRDFGIDESYHEDFVRLFKENCEYLGLKEGQAVSEKTVGEQRGRTSTASGVKSDGTVTVAEPDGGPDAALTCFVIMPFTERNSTRPPNFFNEVLKRLITPACIDAGFRVVSADRRGSDVIHSTIVNSLLDADLVLCDLTEHNPNVLFELGMRMHADKPIALIQAEGTARIFDVDNVLRVFSYNPNLWGSTLEKDRPDLLSHVAAAWENRDSAETYLKLLRRKPA
jgi:hypothetical protein